MDLKRELRKRGLKQVRVATQLGIHPTRFSGMCNGWARPTPEQRERISEYLGTDPDELFPLPQEDSQGAA